MVYKAEEKEAISNEIENVFLKKTHLIGRKKIL